MANRTQLLKGILEGCVLKIIENHETYGYEIVEKLKNIGLIDISEGSIYPLLIRLEKAGYLNSQFKESPFGPKRKYYTLSKAGEDELKDFENMWTEMKNIVDKIMGDE
ncbi:PadR family transcriptional regulator [Fonticella tunisiensis]|uniref:PadR family transcriptional regulator n=1 Tax=Fonticella tunisiensis TaxID=1096341 RepID=A0A4R7KSQ8_9CLOT|nr:PadR family transcriptional regulator [Fonticella tunisiensis]TDT62798.1 PadR family transcriptional regulator [Fonticella tunisiensis]